MKKGESIKLFDEVRSVYSFKFLIAMKTILISSFIIFLQFLSPFTGGAQLIIISGKISNALTGKMLRNVSVFEKNSETGTITNDNGYFKLMLPPGQREFSFSEEGYNMIFSHFNLKRDTTVAIALLPYLPKSKKGADDSLQANIKSKKKNHIGRKLRIF